MRLSKAALDEMLAHARETHPAECCGALAGRVVSGDVKEVVRLEPAVNRRTDDPHRYLIAPEDSRRLEKQLKSEGLEIVGYYHSHPDHPAVPSAFDADHAWPWYSYVIVRVDRGRGADLASWVLENDLPRMQPESLEVLSEV